MKEIIFNFMVIYFPFNDIFLHSLTYFMWPKNLLEVKEKLR
jgi:hypothetical protein